MYIPRAFVKSDKIGQQEKQKSPWYCFKFKPVVVAAVCYYSDSSALNMCTTYGSLLSVLVRFATVVQNRVAESDGTYVL